ncbi:hypothetical protein F4823DRAFT_629589 [Ustulina deusta]|nr:hypothetical protein F4823DRAFT_629589 [Ustulina deusta]
MELPASYHPSPLDEIVPPLRYAFILGFPIEFAHRDHALETLQEGYSRLLRERPYLASDIVRDNNPDVRPGSLKLIIPNNPVNIKLDVADVSDSPAFRERSYASVREAKMPQSWLDPELLAPCVAGVATTTKMITGRVNWINGGCLLTISIAHAALDAQGAFTVIKNWANLCQGSQSLSGLSRFPVGESRQTEAKTATDLLRIQTIPSSRLPFEHLRLRPELWNFLGLHFEDNLAPRASAPSLPTCIPAAATAIAGSTATRMRTCIFSFSSQRSAALKATATSLDGNDWISTNDAYTAHIWTSLMRARFSDEDKALSISDVNKGTHRPLSSVYLAIDGRKLPGCGFVPSRINNAVYCCKVQLPLSTVLERDVLPTLAVAIRQQIEAVKSNQDLINDANALAAAIPAVGRLTYVVTDFLDRDLVTTSWTALPFYDLDFGPGLGKPQFFRIPRGQYTGICCMLPQRPNGDIEVIISAEENEMDRLLADTNFLKYAKLVCE